MAQLVEPDYPGHPERAIVFTVQSWGANCPQHIRPRPAADGDTRTLSSLQRRIEALEAENRALRHQMAASRVAGKMM